MDIIGIGIALFAALVVGRFWRYRSATTSAVKAIEAAEANLAKQRATAVALYLHTLRRELANLLMWRDPERYRDIYGDLYQQVASLRSQPVETVRFRLTQLGEHYRLLEDFDIFGTREYVLYSDGACLSSMTEIEERYRDIVLFMEMSVVAEPAWHEVSSLATDDREAAHLSRYHRQVLDTQLQLRLDHAMAHYYAGRADDFQEPFENDYCTVQSLPHVAENRYGIWLKETGEYGVYSFFVFDYGDVHKSYRRSDAGFRAEHPLDSLQMVVDEFEPYCSH